MQCIDATYCYHCSMVCVCVCVGHNCESDKTAELIEVPFGIWSWIDPRNYVSARSPEMGNFFLTHCEVL